MAPRDVGAWNSAPAPEPRATTRLRAFNEMTNSTLNGTLDQVATFLVCDRKTLRRMMDDGEISFLKVRGHYVFLADDVIAYAVTHYQSAERLSHLQKEDLFRRAWRDHLAARSNRQPSAAQLEPQMQAA